MCIRTWIHTYIVLLYRDLVRGVFQHDHSPMTETSKFKKSELLSTCWHSQTLIFRSMPRFILNHKQTITSADVTINFYFIFSNFCFALFSSFFYSQLLSHVRATKCLRIFDYIDPINLTIILSFNKRTVYLSWRKWNGNKYFYLASELSPLS